MRVGIFSDLHLEFAPWKYTFLKDVLYINAGDTDVYRDGEATESSLIEASIEAAGSRYFEVLGNHDFYNSQFPYAEENQHYEEFGDIKIAGVTLWTPMNPVDFFQYKYSMVDVDNIRGLTCDTYTAAHEADKRFLKAVKADIVVTHHSPSMKGCHPRWKGDACNHFFHNNLDNLVEELQPKLWVHGHSHDEADYMIGKTRVICHPRGYPDERNFKKYVPKYVDIK